jgi:membrane protease YdiL (CAAX protease family)
MTTPCARRSANGARPGRPARDGAARRRAQGRRLARGGRARGGGAAAALIVVPVVTGAATFAVFYGAARVVRRHRTLRRAIASVLRYADAGSTPLVVLIASGSGVAEELFFRGALWYGRSLRTTTLAYAASTAATGNPALVLAGLITSVIFGWRCGRKGWSTPFQQQGSTGVCLARWWAAEVSMRGC